MFFSHRILPGLLLFFFSTSVFSQIKVDVEIKGLNKQLEDNVRLYLSAEQQKDHALMSEGRLRRLHKKAPKEIATALQPYGYYRPMIQGELVQTSPEKWQASYNVDPGPGIPIAEFNFSISEDMGNDPAFQPLLLAPNLQTGNVFNHLAYEKFKNSLTTLASERGYFTARFTQHHVTINLETYEAAIQLDYEGGPRYNFGEVALEQDVLDTEFLKRYIPFEKGTPYSLNALIDLQQALHDSDYFQTVEVSPEKVQPDSNEVPVTVTLTPRKPRRYSIGLGYGTDTGARTKLGLQIPRVNTRGHRFDSEAKISEIGYRLSANYRIPVLNPRTDQLVFTAGRINEKTDTSDSTIITVGASLNRSRNKWRETFSLNYQEEFFVIGDDEGDSTLLIPGVNWSRIWGDNFINTIDGLRFDIGLRGATEEIISDTSFAQLQGGIKAITSLGKKNRIISRGSFGGTLLQEFRALPSSVRFFSGGAQSVRGYAYQSLGPTNENGQVVGGQHLLVGSLEFEHSFNKPWGAAVFYDVGNAIDNLNDDLKHGAGFGFRWKSPVGPIRIDIARALSLDGQPWRLHINIGPDL